MSASSASSASPASSASSASPAGSPATLHTDVLVLGAGTAGLNARRGAETAGASVLMVDPGPFGTTCARVGCMPSKLLIAAADAAHHVASAEGFGVHAGPVRVDGKAVMRRVQAERDRFAGRIIAETEDHERAGRVLRGLARFDGPQSAVVTAADGSETRVTFRAAVIATGSAPFVPPPLRALPAWPAGPLLDNTSVFELPDLPRSLLVVGAGVIGVELGQAMARLGVQVTIIGVGGGFAGIVDQRVREAAIAAIGAELDLHLDAPLELAEALADGGARAVFVDRDGQRRDHRYDLVLGAAGRRANVTRLGLDAAGVALDRNGVPTALDPMTLQLGDSPLFLAGDVNDLHPLLHEAADDGRSAGQNAARFPELTAVPRRTPLGIVFADPNIGFAGQRGGQLDDSAVCMGEVRFDDQGRARVMRQARGLLRIWGDRRTGTLLGAEFVGPRMEHVAHLLAWAIQQRLTVAQALEMPFYHPVIEEGLRTALQQLAKNLRFAPPVGQPCNCVTPGA